MHSCTLGLRRAARRWALGALVGVLGLAGSAAHATDDPPGRVGRLAEGRGQIWLLEDGQGEWQTATLNRPLTTADRVATDRGARAELQIGSTVVRLGEASDLEIARLDDDRIELMLHSGVASLRVREPEVARELQVSTPEGRFAPRGPGLFRLDRTERGTLAGVTQGELDFESGDSQLALRPGQRADLWFDSGDRRTHYSWAQPVNDEFEQWVRREDAQQASWSASRPVSPEMTGASDLDRYGQWASHPEYGSLWYPTTVVSGWAPYRFGHWAWVRPWGWTWVDDAPWGFAPFHYGRWVFWGGRWCWAPGSYVRRPVYAPAMVAWVGGSRFGVSIRVGGGQPVGWVPLAPREVYYPAYRVSPVYIKQVNVTHIHVHDRDPRPPREPIMYRNSQVRGGVTVVSSDVLTRREAVYRAPRPADDDVARVMRSAPAVQRFEPPRPADASFAPRQPVSRERRIQAPPPPNGAGRPTMGFDDGRPARPPQQREGEAPSMRPAVVPAPPARDRREPDGPGLRQGAVPMPAGRDAVRDLREQRELRVAPPDGAAGGKGPDMRVEPPVVRPPVARPPVSPVPHEPAAPVVVPPRRDIAPPAGAERPQREREPRAEQPRMMPQPVPVPVAPRGNPRDDGRVERPQEQRMERMQERMQERAPERGQPERRERRENNAREPRGERRAD